MAENSTKLAQLPECWLTIEWVIAQLCVQVQNIADRNGLAVQTWVEDGWGTVSGFGGQLNSGALISLLEIEYLVSTGKQRGPTLYALPTDVDRLGIENLLSETLTTLGLEDSDVETRHRAPTTVEVEAFKRATERVSF